MSLTPSTMLELGTPAPVFSLVEPATGNIVSLDDYVNHPVLITFICNHCPYVIHILEKFVNYTTDCQTKGLNVIAINSNDVANYSADSPEKMIEFADKYDFTFPYLFDETQSTAQAYQAACTPDFFMFDADHKLYYRGQFDDARPRSTAPITGADMKEASDALLNNQPAPIIQKASLGCNIKWIAGNEPEYFG